MDLLGAVIRGVTQGVTEFLPISSDGHLVVVGRFLGEAGTGRDALGFDILLHCGSLIAILVVFRDAWIRVLRGLFARDAAAWRMAVMICVATVPGVFAGLFFEDTVAGMRSFAAAGAGFLVTGAFLVAGEFIGKRRGERTPGFLDAILIGVAQAVAILPGVSRSGLTLSTGRALGVERSAALDFSFLMALPIIAGAVAKTGLDAFDGSVAFPPLPVSLAGFAASLVVSVAAAAFLRRFVLRNSVAWFAWYLVPLALLLFAEDAGLRAMLEPDHARIAIRGLGSLAVFSFALVEVIPPFSFVSPGITALIVAGSVAPDAFSVASFSIAAFSASFIGNAVLFAIGRKTGPSIEDALRLPAGSRRKAEDFVRKYGAWAVFAGQFFSIFRPTVAFAAGVLSMHPAKFYPMVLAGAAAWASSSIVAGYALKEHVAVVASVVFGIGTVSMLVVASVAAVEWWRVRRTKSRS